MIYFMTFFFKIGDIRFYLTIADKSSLCRNSIFFCELIDVTAFLMNLFQEYSYVKLILGSIVVYFSL